MLIPISLNFHKILFFHLSNVTNNIFIFLQHKQYLNFYFLYFMNLLFLCLWGLMWLLVLCVWVIVGVYVYVHALSAKGRHQIPYDQSYRKGGADRGVLEIEPVSTWKADRCFKLLSHLFRLSASIVLKYLFLVFIVCMYVYIWICMSKCAALYQCWKLISCLLNNQVFLTLRPSVSTVPSLNIF